MLTSWYFRDWKYSALACFTPLFIICFILPFILPESPRWLYEQGRVDESINVLNKIGEVNGKELSTETEKLLREGWSAKKEDKPNVFQLLLKHKVLAMRFAILLVIQ